MRDQGVLELSDEDFQTLLDTPVPQKRDIQPPTEQSKAPYFTDWLRQQVVDKYGPGQTFGGGLEIKSTLDLGLQDAADQAVSDNLSGLGPTAAVVAIDNGSGEVLAMVGGQDFDSSPFNLATNGQRQPGSSFKPFTLVTALKEGHSPDETFESAPQRLPFKATIRKNGKKKQVTDLFRVSNYDDKYLGSASIASATTYSDNSVYAQLGFEVGIKDIVKTAHELGITSRVDDNPAIILGGDGEQFRGSGRSIPAFDLAAALQECSDLLLRQGGHAMAAGLTLAEPDLPAFERAFHTELRQRLDSEALQGVLETDGELRDSDFDLAFSELLRDAGPWGQGFPEPLFEGVFAVVNQRLVGSSHLKLSLRPDGSRRVLDAIAFHQAAQQAQPGQKLRLAYRLDIDGRSIVFGGDTAPVETDVFRARIFWLGHEPMTLGKAYKLKLGTLEAQVTVQSIERIIDTSDLSNSSAPQVERNQVAEVILRARRMLALDSFIDFPSTGRFVLVEKFDIAGGGIISMEGYADQRNAIDIAFAADHGRHANAL